MRILTVVAIILAISSESLAAQPRAASMAGRSPVYAPHGVVATSQPLASAAGLAVLERGGNAVDAAVTAAAVLSVVEPMMTGIGGDMFVLEWSAKEHKLIGLNSSGRAGALMTVAELKRRGHSTVPVKGIEAVTVPGALAGWAAILQRSGTITLAEALAPAIRFAEEGFPVTPVIAADWEAETALLIKDDGARATFLLNGTHAPKPGEWFRNPDYARTLRAIAKDGPSALYGGALGAKLVARSKELGGFLTIDDLRKHKPEWVTPISATFHGYRVWELPPNGQGVAVLEMLKILEPYDLKSMGQNSTAYLHLLIETKKLAYADLRQFVGDTNGAATVAHLLSNDFITKRRAEIDLTKANARGEPGPAMTASETIYLTTADSHGNMVSFINSLFDAFGSGVVVPGTGFALHNRGSAFSLEPGMPNTVAPGKRPFHTLIPAFVTRPKAGAESDATQDEPWMSFGVMGGAMQPQGHVQVLLNMLVFGQDVQSAIDAARFRHRDGLQVWMEPPIGDGVRAALTAMGHQINNSPTGREYGGGQAIVKLTRGYVAGSDPRKDGAAVGH
ncbi:MAG: gamma-glutamyltransferase family protein [Gemmatimonadota bacterium]|nr:gamma-glutamyltransferase family protein [Gemmatimonadota bacterium]